MPTLQVVSARPLSGKTTIAVALAQGLAATGASIRLVRLGSVEAAVEDAATFADCLFASSPGQPLAAADTATATGPNVITIYESDAGVAPLTGVPAVLVVRGAPDDTDSALITSLGDRLLGTIATAVVGNSIEDVGRQLTNTGFRPLAVLPEDRALAAPSVSEIQASLDASVLYDGDNGREVVEDVLIAPVYADPARPLFHRFASKAILSPFNKTDLHLAAIESQAACLVITGGQAPSPYILDRAQHGNTTVLLAEGATSQAVASISDAWATSRFRGERKGAAAFAHLNAHFDFPNLAKRITG